MRGWASAVLAGAAVLLLPGTTSAATPPPEPHVLFGFADERIDESSGLVDGGDVLFTVNDSGDGPYVYAVDKSSGETVAVTTYSGGEVTDVEALAGTAEELWVGDIGDNDGVRETIDVYRFTPAVRGDRTVAAERYSLTYPDAAQNAETLLVHPRTGRLHVVTKSLFGGAVYAAPRRLRDSATGSGQGAANRLELVTGVPGLVTDGAFLADGRHVILRGYTGAAIYTFPGFDRVGDVALPRQQQGEAIAVGPDERVYVSSEGEGSEVFEVPLPTEALASPPSEPAGSPPSPAESVGPGLRADDGAGRRVPPGTDRPPWLAVGTFGLVLGAVGWRAVRASRRRGRRTP